ncbi:hypothetical protein F5B22DRAFT_602868 [Xylaria bambusicola]|uniref:uncharacterized protein n=1 Tax=Xylaria bambusicola TaxID=326684 RepID=UPI0020085843|nr:uncharacterized protein F5B22DRAFT_602868 [Xylaria bambusicola]KAI0517894.1 hypothetical protein F5B22DRAFT_602868 [Xylaria bambusicola]
MQSQEPYDGLEVALPERHWAHEHEQSDLAPSAHRLETSLQEPRRKCGLPLRSFYIILGIVIIFILAAIAGGVGGGLSSKSSHNQHQEDATNSDGNNHTNGGNLTNPTSYHILPTSHLSATNWTDPDGYTHRFIFFQDGYGAIVARRWNTQNQSWTTDNLTDIFQTSRTPINPLSPSTPIASISFSYNEINNTRNKILLWYIAPDNTIASVEVQDLVDAPEEWTFKTLDGEVIETYPGSQLAAAWNRCLDICVGYWAVAYQRPGDAGINVLNGSDKSHASLAVESDRVVAGTSLALTPEVQTDGDSVARLTLMSESLLSSDSGKAQKSTYEAEWYHDGELLSGTTLPAPSTMLQFSITLLDNFRTVVFLALLPNGTVAGSYYRSHFVSIPAVDFRGGPSDLNFTAIATSEEAMFYGISNDEIHQYSVDHTDPTVFQYIDTIFP